MTVTGCWLSVSEVSSGWYSGHNCGAQCAIRVRTSHASGPQEGGSAAESQVAATAGCDTPLQCLWTRDSGRWVGRWWWVWGGE